MSGCGSHVMPIAGVAQAGAACQARMSFQPGAALDKGIPPQKRRTLVSEVAYGVGVAAPPGHGSVIHLPTIVPRVSTVTPARILLNQF
jgi:hypothetical protein